MAAATIQLRYFKSSNTNILIHLHSIVFIFSEWHAEYGGPVLIITIPETPFHHCEMTTTFFIDHVDGLSILQHNMIENVEQPVQIKTRPFEGDTSQVPVQLCFANSIHKRRRSSCESSDEDTVVSLPKRLKAPSFIVKNKEVSAFFRLLGLYNSPYFSVSLLCFLPLPDQQVSLIPAL